MNRQHQLNIDSQCDCCEPKRREIPPVEDREPYRDVEREWAGLEERRPFVPSNWQEGDPF